MKRTYLMLVFATLFWGANFIFAKIALQTLTPGLVATGRFLMASLLLLSIFAFKKGNFNWADIQPKLPVLLVSGVVGVFLYNLMMFVGLKTTSATNGALIMGLNPMFTLILSSFMLGTGINKFQLLGIVLSFLGVIFVISNGSLNTLLHLNFVAGDLLLIVSSIVFGLYNVINRKYLPGFNTLNLTAITTFTATILFLGYTVFTVDVHTIIIVPEAILSLAFMGIFGSVLAYYFWNYGVQQMGADHSAIFINFVPFFASLISVLQGHSITPVQICGGLLIISGVFISNKFKPTN
jgi:drug/metabolite transporter (DMT)-like permease